jgi:hypothetical protein
VGRGDKILQCATTADLGHDTSLVTYFASSGPTHGDVTDAWARATQYLWTNSGHGWLDARSRAHHLCIFRS